MRILKIKGKDEQTITKQIEKEYGGTAVILNTHQEKVDGFLGVFKKPQYVVTIAIEEEPILSAEPPEMVTRLDEIKLQMQELRQELQETKKKVPLAPIVQTPEPQNKFYHLFEQKLSNEGVHLDVIRALLENLSDEMEIDEIVRLLYTKIIQTFEMPAQQEDCKKVFFIGPTGVGKTTTIAKLTADKVLNKREKVTLITADTYRIAAIEQLRTYAEILDVPIEIVYEDQDLKNYLHKWEQDVDYLLIDTAGRSHKNVEQMIHMQQLLKEVSDKKVYLVMNMNTQFQDVQRIIESYELLTPYFEVIVTKADETDVIGNILNIAYCGKKPIVYMTTGQGVPDDFVVFDYHEYTRDLLGRISYE
ncbi:MAG: GTPase [Cellulosilyticaceae bacterium]